MVTTSEKDLYYPTHTNLVCMFWRTLKFLLLIPGKILIIYMVLQEWWWIAK